MTNSYKNAMDKLFPSKDFEEKIKLSLKERLRNRRDKRIRNICSLIATATAACVLGVVLLCGFPLFSGRGGYAPDSSGSITHNNEVQDPINSYVVKSSEYKSSAASYKSSIGECIVSEEVQNAITDNDKDALFFVSVFISDKNGTVDSEIIKSEEERLKGMAYNVFIEKEELLGLLTKEQILNFSIDSEYAYLIEWVRDENGIVDWEQ